MNKTFVNLSSKYRTFLDGVDKSLTAEDKLLVQKKGKSEHESKKILSLYDKIHSSLPKVDCTEYDMNAMMHGYKKNNETIDLLKNIAMERNMQVMLKASKSAKWQENIERLQEHCTKVFKGKCSKKLVQDAFLHLLSTYRANWMGCWTIIEQTKTGQVQDINVFDTHDYDVILIYVAKEKNWQIKDKNELERLQKIEGIKPEQIEAKQKTKSKSQPSKVTNTLQKKHDKKQVPVRKRSAGNSAK